MSDSPRIFCSPPLLFGAVLIVSLWLDGSFDRALNSPTWARVAGSVIATIGLMLIVSSLSHFHSQGTRPEPWKSASSLITTGIYRHTRNPMYLGMVAIYIGVALFFISGLAALLLVPLLVLMNNVIIPREEAYLSREFGHEYVRYLGRAPRWL